MAECQFRQWPFKCASPAPSGANESGCPSYPPVHLFHWSLYETIASPLHPRRPCRLCPKPDGALDAVRRAAESCGGVCRCCQRSQKSLRHRAAQPKLSGRAGTAERIWHRWLYSCHCRLRWKSWHAIGGERQLPRSIAIRCSLLSGLRQIAKHFHDSSPRGR